MPLIYKGSLLEKVREENRGGTIHPKFTWKMAIEMEVGQYVLFRSLAILDPRVGHTMDVLSPFISILCHSD